MTYLEVRYPPSSSQISNVISVVVTSKLTQSNSSDSNEFYSYSLVTRVTLVKNTIVTLSLKFSKQFIGRRTPTTAHFNVGGYTVHTLLKQICYCRLENSFRLFTNLSLTMCIVFYQYPLEIISICTLAICIAIAVYRLTICRITIFKATSCDNNKILSLQLDIQ